MALTANTIDHRTLSHLIEAGAVRTANIVGQPGGWAVVVAYGTTERALAAKRGQVRVFRKFETLASYLKEMGLVQYQVDARQFDPEALKTERTRTDAAERLRKAHAAAVYVSRLASDVQEAIDDPRPSVPHAQVVAEWETERTTLLHAKKPAKARR